MLITSKYCWSYQESVSKWYLMSSIYYYFPVNFLKLLTQAINQENLSKSKNILAAERAKYSLTNNWSTLLIATIWNLLIFLHIPSSTKLQKIHCLSHSIPVINISILIPSNTCSLFACYLVYFQLLNLQYLIYNYF